MATSRWFLTLALATAVACNGADKDDAADNTDTDVTSSGTPGDVPEVEVDPQDLDDDGDGVTPAQGDCDDGNADVSPSAPELCNNIDDNCNNEIDEDPIDGTVFYRDGDSDTYGDPNTTLTACELPGGYSFDATDCNDAEASANPAGVEVNWNDIDEDCNGLDYQLDDCIAAALDATSEYMAEGYWAVGDYLGTYEDPFIGAFPIADWIISNQFLYLVETNTTLTEQSGGYAVGFESLLGMNDLIDPFYIDVSTSFLAELAGVNYDLYCDGYVNPLPAAFEGTFDVQVDADNQLVTASASLSPNYDEITQDDVVMTDPESGLPCLIDIFDLIADNFGYGDTLGIIDESFATTSILLQAEYEQQLEDNIQEACSAAP